MGGGFCLSGGFGRNRMFVFSLIGRWIDGLGIDVGREVGLEGRGEGVFGGLFVFF